MSRNCPFIPADYSLRQLVDSHIFGAGRRCFVVTQGNNNVGLLILHRIKEIPLDVWQSTTSDQIMIPIENVERLKPDIELEKALQEMDRLEAYNDYLINQKAE